MRFSSYVLPALAANLAAALPRPQDIDFDLVLAAPDPTFTEAVGVTAQTITVDPQALIASATAAVSSVSVDADDVLSSTAVAHKRAAPTICVSQPAGATSAPTYAANADNAANFLANTYYASVASAAPTPSGYSQAFLNKQASNNAFGYLGFSTMNDYDVNKCATQCTNKFGCVSFNIYFERDPSVDPNDPSCSNPSSVTMIKCVYWGGQVTELNAVNKGQMRGGFTVAIAGSNGYVTTQLATPAGYRTGVPFGKFAINAPYDAQGYNTYMGAKMFTGVWNVDQCAQFCDAQTQYNLATAPSDGTPAKVCKFFNTYLLTAKMANGQIVPQGQYCSLYTEAWPIKYATNGGQWRGQDQYTVDYSFGYSKVASSSDIDPLVGDAKGATYQAVADIKWSSLQPFCSTYLGYTTPLSTVTATATITPVSTSTSYSTSTVAAMRKRDSNSTFPGLSTDSSIGGLVLIDGNNVTWYSDKVPAGGPLIVNHLAKRGASVAIPAGLAKYQAAVISAACSMQANPVSSTSVLTASATVTGLATTTVVTVVSTVTSQPSPTIDNLILAASGATWTESGYPQGSGPMEFFPGYTWSWSNLRSYGNFAPYVIKAAFQLDSATGHLTSTALGGVVACAYNANLDANAATVVEWLSAADLQSRSTTYGPLVCSKSTSGQVSCTLASQGTSVTLSNLVTFPQGNIGWEYLGISGRHPTADEAASGDLRDATLTFVK